MPVLCWHADKYFRRYLLFGPTTSAIHCWPPNIHCARPHGLELLAGRPLCTAGYYESFRQRPKTGLLSSY